MSKQRAKDEQPNPRHESEIYDDVIPLSQIELQQWTAGLLYGPYNEERGKGQEIPPGALGQQPLGSIAPNPLSQLEPGLDYGADLDTDGSSDAVTEDGMVDEGAAAEREVQSLAAQAVQQAVEAAREKKRRGEDGDAGVDDGRVRTGDGGVNGADNSVGDSAGQARVGSASARSNRAGARTGTFSPHQVQLLEAAVADARKMVGDSTSAHAFTPQETAALEMFLRRYCEIQQQTMAAVKARIWAHARHRDGFWRWIQRILPGRTKSSLYKHVRRTYHPFKIRGKWNAAEDAKLAEAVRTHQGKWPAVGREMGRMPEDCRDRWRNYIKCGTQRHKNKWSPAEEEALRRVVGKLGPGRVNWTKVSEMMGGTRSRIQCRYKWKKLVRRDGPARNAQRVRVARAGLETKIWLLNAMKDALTGRDIDSAAREEDAPARVVDWAALASAYPGKATADELRAIYEEMGGEKGIAGQDEAAEAETIQRLLYKYDPQPYNAPPYSTSRAARNS